MTRFKIFSTAVMLSLMFATPVFAQAAIQEPGAFAFAYPNYDVLNGGQPTPAARMDAIAGYGPFSGSYAYAAPDGTANGASRPMAGQGTSWPNQSHHGTTARVFH